jgi:hypothetical protein
MKRVIALSGLLLATQFACSRQPAANTYDLNESEVCTDDDALFDLEDRVAFCDVGQPTAAVATRCIQDLASLFRTLPASCRADAKSALLVSQNLVIRTANQLRSDAFVKNLELDRDTKMYQEWVDFFKVFGLWYDAFGKQFYPDYQTRTIAMESFQAAYDNVFLALQTSIESHRSFQVNNGNLNSALAVYSFSLDAAATALEQSDADGREIFMDLLALALNKLDRRLQLQTLFHDIECWIRPCSLPGLASPTPQMVEALAKMDDPAEYSTVVSRMVGIPDDVMKVFQTIRDHHERLIDILKESPESASNLPGLGNDYKEVIQAAPQRTPRHIRSYALINESYKRLHLRWTTTASFYDSSFGEVRNPFDERSRKALLDLLQQRTLSFSNRNQSVQAEASRALQQVQADLDAEIIKDQLAASSKVLGLDIAENTKKLLAVRASQEGDREAFDTLVRQVLAIADSKLFSSPSEQVEQTLAVSNLDAKFDPLNPGSPSSFTTIELKKGDIFNIGFSGTYSPSCAIARSEFKEIVNQGFEIEASGFMLSRNQGSFKATSVETFKSSVQYNDTNFSASLGPAGFAGSLRSSYTTGSRSDSGTRESKVDTKSKSDSFSVANGVRLRNTPFPKYPAGSIVGMGLPSASASTSERSIFLVGRGLTYLAPYDLNLKLYVNDCANQTLQNQAELKGVYSVRRPSNELAKAVLNAVIDGTQEFEDRRDELLAMGSVSHTEIESLRGKIILNAQNAVKSTTQDLGMVRTILDLGNILIDQKANTVRKAIAAYELELAISRDEEKLAEIQSRSEIEISKRRLLADLLTQNRVNLDISLAGLDAQRLADYLLNDIRPIIDIYYPKLLGTITSQDQGDLGSVNRSLTQLSSYSTPLYEKLQALQNILENINNTLKQSTITLDNTIETNYVMVALLPQAPTSRKSYPLIEDYRSRSIYESIKSESNSFELPIQRSDLYSRPSKQFGLSLRQSRPIIRKALMGFGLRRDQVISEDYLRDLGVGRTVTMTIGNEMSFPTSTGPRVFAFSTSDNRETLSKQIPISFIYEGNTSALLQQLKSSSSTAGLGYTPFSTLKFDETSGLFADLMFENPDLSERLFNFVQEIYLIMEIEAQTVESSMSWLEAELRK